MKTLDPKLVRIFPIIIQDYKEKIQQFQKLNPNEVYQKMVEFDMNAGICHYSSWNKAINEDITSEVSDLRVRMFSFWCETANLIVENYFMVNLYLDLNDSHKKRMLDSMQFRIDKMEELLAQHNISLCL